MFFSTAVALAIVSLASASTTKHGYQHDGKANRDLQESHIVGGDNAVAGEFPFMVQMEFNGSLYCGGSLIRDQYVLTAAHCEAAIGETARLGTLTRASGGTTRQVVDVRTHPMYNGELFDNDVAVVKLDSPVDHTELPGLTGTIALNEPEDSSQPEVGELLTAIGFGRTSTGAPVSDTLLKVQVGTVSTEVCDAEYFFAFISPDFHLCATSFGKGTCQGDSGGPLLEDREDGTKVQVGISSFGSSAGCAHPDFSSVFARISTYKTWIDGVIAEMDGGSCTADTDCPGGVCIEETGECVECLSNGHCATNSGNVYCDKSFNVCVECFRNGHCANNPNMKFGCDLDEQVCVECTKDAHCAGNEDRTACDKRTNTCVGCTRNGHCDVGGCDLEALVCVQCTRDAHCAGNEDHIACDKRSNTCVGCTRNGHCADNPNGDACDFPNQSCVECTANRHCQGNENGYEACNKETNMCVECTRNNHCGQGVSCDMFTNMCDFQ